MKNPDLRIIKQGMGERLQLQCEGYVSVPGCCAGRAEPEGGRDFYAGECAGLSAYFLVFGRFFASFSPKTGGFWWILAEKGGL